MKSWFPVALAVLFTAPASAVAPPFRIVSILEHDVALDEAHDVALSEDGALAFVPGKGGSIAIIDVADPAHPALLWFRHDPEALPDSETVLPIGDHLFLGTEDFHSLDISNPKAPKFEGVISDRTRIRRINGMVRRGDTIFAACKEGWINAFDISDPEHPRLAGSLETREAHAVRYPHDIDLFGPHVVVVDPRRFGREEKLGKVAVFRVFDITGALLPASRWTLTGAITCPELTGANRIEIRGNHAFVAGSYGVDLAKESHPTKGAVIDLSNPEKPRLVASVPFPDARGPNGLTLAGDVWFLAGGQTVEAFDIRNPEAPQLLAAFKSVEAFPTPDDNAHDLVYRDGYLYVSGQGDNRFIILHVDDPEIRRRADNVTQASRL